MVSVLTRTALLLLACAGAPDLAQAQETVPPELKEIRFVGAQAFPIPLLRAAIISNASRCRNLALELLRVCSLGLGREKLPADLVALQSDLLRLRIFYFERGFREARIVLDTVTRNNALTATFQITEGQPIRVVGVQLKGTEAFDEPARTQITRSVGRLPLRAGDPLSLIAYEAARDSLLNLAQNLGYARAEVFAGYLIPRDSARSARIEYDLAPGSIVYFREPELRGNRKVAGSVIRRMLAWENGNRYSREAILRTQRNLFGLDVFSSIDVRVDLESGADTVAPIIEVSEGALNRYRLGAGLNTAEFVNAEGRWTGRDFLGGARRIEVRGRIANVLAEPLDLLPGFESAGEPYNRLNGSVTADFTQPWFFDAGNSLGLGLFVERRSIPDVFVRNARGGYIAVTRSFGPGLTGSFGYRPELTRLDAADLVFCTSFVACEQSEIRVLREPHWLAPLSLSFARDRSNSLFAPTRGSVLRVDAEYAAAASGSEFSYLRMAGEWTMYREPLAGLVLATRVRPGWARANNEPGAGLGLHPQKRFFAGGANSVRGFGQYQLGPKLLTIDAVDDLVDADTARDFPGCTAQQINAGLCDVTALAARNSGLFDLRPVGGAVALEANLELRFPLVGDKLRGAAFLDLGQVWPTPAAFRPADLVLTPGLGLRYFSAIGPVRIDLGYNPQSGERLGVLTTRVCDREVDPCTSASIRPDRTYTRDELENTRELRSLGYIDWGRNRSFLDRLQLHFSIGQAF